MKPHLLICLSLMSSLIVSVICEPITVALLSAAAAGLSYMFYDHQKECWNRHMPADFHELQANLEKKVYGQHIAVEVVVNALRAHWDSPYAQKALVLSFHGPLGSGKNYITKFMIESIYKKGALSKNVHMFNGRMHFPLKEKSMEYQIALREWIATNVTRCPYQLFIFDEVDKMPYRLLDSLKPYLDYHAKVDRIDMSKSVFIFLSNTGGNLIINQMMELWHQAVPRNEIKLSHFEKLISMGAFNEEGGLKHSETIKSSLIDHYIPFLPMEYEHVKNCIVDEFTIRGVYNQQMTDEVMNTVEWGPDPEKKFSKTGCKRLSQKVAELAIRYRKNLLIA